MILRIENTKNHHGVVDDFNVFFSENNKKVVHSSLESKLVIEKVSIFTLVCYLTGQIIILHFYNREYHSLVYIHNTQNLST